MSRAKDLTKKTAIIALGKISTQFVSFLLLPLYTALLSKSEYGTVDLIITIVHLLIPMSSLMIDQGAFRYLLNCNTDEEKRSVISSSFVVSCGTSLCCLIIYLIASIFVNTPLKVWVLLILVAISFSNLFLQIARGLKNTTYYALGSFVCSTVTIVLNVVCIVALHQGATGMLTATFLGNLACAVFLLLKLRIYKYISFSQFSLDTIKRELQYSIPLVPNQLSLWVMNSSDRFIVSFILGTAANGLLAVSHKFPTLYMSVFNIFQLAWHEIGAVHYFDEDRDEFFTDMLKKVVTIFSTLCMGIIVALPIVFNWFINGNYHEAYYNIPIYLIASLFNVVVGLLGVVYVATKKTAEIAKTTMLAAAINIVVHLALIKFVGLYAASISTFVGYGSTMVFRIIDTKKYLKIKYDVKQFVGTGIALAICSYIYYLDNKVVSIIFLPFFLAAAYIFNRETVNGVVKTVDQKIEGKINKKLFVAIITVILASVVAAGGLFVYKKVTTNPKAIQTEYKSEIKEVNAEDIIRFSDFGSEDFTCTGLTYDSKDEAFWIGDYGAMNSEDQAKPRIIEVDGSFGSVLRTVELNDLLDSSANLQGVSYDNSADCLWLAVGDAVVALNKDGAIIGTIELGEYAEYKSNGICYDERDDSLWILCASRHLLHYCKDGNLLGAYPFNYSDQDHICTDGQNLYITVGADYQGTNNYVCKVSTQDGSITALYRVIGANALEGICFVDKMIMIANDGQYHSDVIGRSYISVFDAEELLR